MHILSPVLTAELAASASDATYSIMDNKLHTVRMVTLMVKNILKNFGDNVREKRLEKGWSQEELAQKCGLHRTYIGSIEQYDETNKR